MSGISPFSFFFFLTDTATTEIYTLSLHDALPISPAPLGPAGLLDVVDAHPHKLGAVQVGVEGPRSEEHTSELQSHSDLVCRLLLEKKKMIAKIPRKYIHLQKK